MGYFVNKPKNVKDIISNPISNFDLNCNIFVTSTVKSVDYCSVRPTLLRREKGSLSGI